MSKHACSGLFFRNLHKRLEDIEVLLCMEPSTCYGKGDFRWSLPGGRCCGNKTKGEGCCTEKPEDTVVREFQEEAGYIVEPVRLLFGKREQSSVPRALSGGKSYKFSKLFYLVDIRGGIRLRKKPFPWIESPYWFKVTRLPGTLIPIHRKVIEMFIGSLIKVNGQKSR